MKLVPLKDLNYLIDLSVIENKGEYTREEITDTVNKYGREFWTVEIDGECLGVIGYFQIGEYYILEALKDHSKSNIGITNSIKAGHEVIETMRRFTNKIRTIARERDKAIQILCKKMGFNEIGTDSGYIIYEKEVDKCQ